MIFYYLWSCLNKYMKKLYDIKKSNEFSMKEKLINTFVSISHKEDHGKINFNYNKKISVNEIWNVSMHSEDIKNKEILTEIFVKQKL